MSNEKALNSENLISQSADLGSWSDANPPYTTVTSNATTAPDGTTTAAQLTGLTGTNKKAIYYPISAGTGSYTSVCFVKPDGHEYVQLMFGGVTTIYQNYHLSGSGTLGNGTNDAASIDKMGDWYRITITSSSLSSATNYYLVMVDSNTAARYQDSASTSSIYAWGANFSSTNQKVFNSTSGQIHREYSPLLKEASADAPRFEYAADGQSVGLKIEASATNLFTYSHELNQWSSARSTVDQNSAIGPTGELTADTLRIDGTDTDSHYIYQTPSVTSGTAYTSSAYVKPAGLTHFAVRFQSAFTDSLVIFNATTGAVTSNSQSLSTSTTSVGNGWFRLSATATATSSTSAAITIYACDTDSSVNVATGDSFRGLLITGLQFEAASAPSSLISTSGASATRAADSCSVATSSFGFTGGPVSVYTDADAGAGYYPTVFALTKDGTSPNSIRLFRSTSTSTIETDFRFNVKTDSANVVSKVPAGSGTVSKFAVRADTDNSAVKPRGITLQSDTACPMPVVGSLDIGFGLGVGHLNGTIRNLMLWNVALSDTELAALVD
jgi:hypothetical protein